MDNLITEKILLTQFGAIKPPWISEDVFYKLPFNFCDRWCERCRLKNICRVYQKEKEREKRFIQQGIHPKSWQATFATTRESFQEIREKLEKEIKRLKIIQEDLGEIGQEEERKDEFGRNDELYRISLKVSKRLVKFLEDYDYYFLDFYEFPEEVKESLGILTYYMHFFPAKIYRAILSNIEEGKEIYKTYDDKTSAFLAYLSIFKIVDALISVSELNKISSKLRQESNKLQSLCTGLNAVLSARFNINSGKL